MNNARWGWFYSILGGLMFLAAITCVEVFHGSPITILHRSLIDTACNLLLMSFSMRLIFFMHIWKDEKDPPTTLAN